MTRPLPAHRDCDRDPGPINSIARIHDILRAHPTVDGKLCAASILALDAMGRVSPGELAARTPRLDPRHRDRQWTPPDAGVMARIRDGLRQWTPEASR